MNWISIFITDEEAVAMPTPELPNTAGYGPLIAMHLLEEGITDYTVFASIRDPVNHGMLFELMSW